jgi:hypothetical protein
VNITQALHFPGTLLSHSGSDVLDIFVWHSHYDEESPKIFPGKKNDFSQSVVADNLWGHQNQWYGTPL